MNERATFQGRLNELILHQDDAIIVANKPAGMLVHRGWAQDDRVLMTEVRDRIGHWVYPIHRLDRGASGAVLFALSSARAHELCRLFEDRRVEKRYLALVRGHPPASMTIDYPIPKRPGGARVPAITEIRCLRTFGRYAWVEARPLSGRLHQIRRHLKHLSCPLIGDVNYGKGEHNRLFRERYGLHRLALHALSLGFAHPQSGEWLEITAPLPADLQRVLHALEQEA